MKSVFAISPDVVGITCFTVQLSDVMRTIEAFGAQGSIWFLWPHINDFPKELYLKAWMLWSRGRSVAFLELLACWEKGEEAKDSVIADELIRRRCILF